MENGIILYTEEEQYMINLDMFENGFEIAL